MNTQQMFDGIEQGDVSCEYFMAWLQGKIEESYVDGYSDCEQDSSKTRERYLSECG